MSAPPSLAEFGFASMTINGRRAEGTRPLLVILVEYSDFPPFSEWHPPTYYEQLAFGDPTPPFSTRDPVNPASLVQYFLENSGGRFTFSSLGVVGPMQRGPLVDPGARKRVAEILSELTVKTPELFVGLNADLDQVLEFDELCVLLVENIPGALPGSAPNSPLVVQIPVDGVTTTMAVTLRFAGGGPRTPFFQLAHEVAHSIGTVDLYNVGAGNYDLTLMSGYDFFADDQVPVHLDPWHKLLLGWVEPQVRSMETSGAAEVSLAPDGVLLLWDESRRHSEYFLLEVRTPHSSTRKYDSGLKHEGFCIWRVGTPVGYAAHLGSPDLSLGGKGVWAAGQVTPFLPWADGTTVGHRLLGTPLSADTWRIEWG